MYFTFFQKQWILIQNNNNTYLLNEEFINIPNYPQIGDEEVQAMLYENRYYSIDRTSYFIWYAIVFVYENKVGDSNVFIQLRFQKRYVLVIW